MTYLPLFVIVLAIALFMDFRIVRALYRFISNRRALNPEANRKN